MTESYAPRAHAFFAYAAARHTITLVRQARAPAPWTTDAILQKYRFCNVFRELDRVTEWYRIHVREPLGNQMEAQVRAAVVFRYLNRIESGAAIRDLLLADLDWDVFLDRVERQLRDIVRTGEPILSAAYMIKTPGGMDKVAGLRVIWRPILQELQTLIKLLRNNRSLEAANDWLSSFPYVGPFMAYEIVTDLRHTPLLNTARDIHTWASPGPGAMRGACRVQAQSLGSLNRAKPKDVEHVVNLMRYLQTLSRYVDYWPADWPAWEMRDVEHTLCEFDKYERVRLGEGAPKQLFKAKGH